MNYSVVKLATKIGNICAKRASQGYYTKGQLKRLANLVSAINRLHNSRGNPVHLSIQQAKRRIKGSVK